MTHQEDIKKALVKALLRMKKSYESLQRIAQEYGRGDENAFDILYEARKAIGEATHQMTPQERIEQDLASREGNSLRATEELIAALREALTCIPSTEYLAFMQIADILEGKEK